ncbi:MAG TPA: hypothetical protein VF628_03135 [Allosphingosinicella sp.]|jgi:hypothetical protein
MTGQPTNAAAALRRALLARIPRGIVNIVNFSSEDWASLTFSGARHEMLLRLEGADADRAADRFLADLDSAEIPLRGHLLADIATTSRERIGDAVEIGLEALTVEEC